MAVLRLVRPLNLLILAVAVGLGGWLAGGVGVWQDGHAARVLRAALSAVLLGAAANALNDVVDVEVDRVNRPGRPLPSGLVSGAVARGIAVGAAAGGLVLAATLSAGHFALALGAAGLMVLYEVRLKRVALVGNLLVALVVALTLIYGGWAAGRVGPVLVAAAFAFLTTLARELVKDVEDVEGDAAAGARTLPVVAGAGVGAGAALGVVTLTLLLTPVPFLLFGYGGLYLLVMLAGAGLLARVAALLMGGVEARRLRAASVLLKVVMAVGIAALALGALPALGP